MLKVLEIIWVLTYSVFILGVAIVCIAGLKASIERYKKRKDDSK